jgi:hypothetical protein
MFSDILGIRLFETGVLSLDFITIILTTSNLNKMGILKHFVLPLFGIVHIASIAACKDLKSWAKLIGRDDATEKDTESIRQNHMLGCLRGFNVAMLTICGYGIFAKTCHSETRQAIAVAEFGLFAVAALDAYELGEMNYLVPAAHSLLALAGTIVSYLEPGIFTKDHSKK